VERKKTSVVAIATFASTFRSLKSELRDSNLTRAASDLTESPESVSWINKGALVS